MCDECCVWVCINYCNEMLQSHCKSYLIAMVVTVYRCASLQLQHFKTLVIIMYRYTVYDDYIMIRP
jgi:hypothetical protein